MHRNQIKTCTCWSMNGSTLVDALSLNVLALGLAMFLSNVPAYIKCHSLCLFQSLTCLTKPFSWKFDIVAVSSLKQLNCHLFQSLPSFTEEAAMAKE